MDLRHGCPLIHVFKTSKPQQNFHFIFFNEKIILKKLEFLIFLYSRDSNITKLEVRILFWITVCCCCLGLILYFTSKFFIYVLLTFSLDCKVKTVQNVQNIVKKLKFKLGSGLFFFHKKYYTLDSRSRYFIDYDFIMFPADYYIRIYFRLEMNSKLSCWISGI